MASAYAIEYTLEVQQARADFMAKFEAAQNGEHAALAPMPVANAYLADDPDVAEAKAMFMKKFEVREHYTIKMLLICF